VRWIIHRVLLRSQLLQQCPEQGHQSINSNVQSAVLSIFPVWIAYHLSPHSRNLVNSLSYFRTNIHHIWGKLSCIVETWSKKRQSFDWVRYCGWSDFLLNSVTNRRRTKKIQVMLIYFSKFLQSRAKIGKKCKKTEKSWIFFKKWLAFLSAGGILGDINAPA